MTKAVWSGIAAAAAVLFVSAPVFAQPVNTDTKTVTVSTTVNARAKLTLGAATVTFADADPDTLGGVLTAAGLSVDVKARTSAAGSVLLTISAPDFSGAGTIPIAALKWTASAGFTTPGTVSNSAVTLGSWTGSGNQSGTQTYTLDNSWSYNTGTYTTTVTYTLTAP